MSSASRRPSRRALLVPVLFPLLLISAEHSPVLNSNPPESLRNIEISSEWTQSKRATLREGFYAEPAAPGAASQIEIQLGEEFAHGQLAGKQVATIVLRTSSGGSGVFVELVLVRQEEDGWRQIASVPLGDRVKIESLRIEEGRILVGLVSHGPADPMCCPTRREERGFTLKGDQLVEVQPTQ